MTIGGAKKRSVLTAQMGNRFPEPEPELLATIENFGRKANAKITDHCDISYMGGTATCIPVHVYIWLIAL